MHFVVVGKDGSDAGALERRLNARPAHLELGDRLQAEGKAVFGIALLDDAGNMVGSIYVMNFPTRAELDAWLAEEPYVLQDVWQEIEIHEGRIGPSFLR